MGLVDQHGRPFDSASFKKAKPPPTGEAFGAWAGRDVTYAQLPGGGLVQFDLSKLTLADYRAMRDHYQVNASLSVLTFMMHQSDWHIECEDKKIADHCEENLKKIWTPLCRSLGTANWAGFSPNVLQWENDTNGNTLQLAKIKDLVPEECSVNWKEVKGWAPQGRTPPKIKIYDGIKQAGTFWPIPVDNSFWFPLLMENGDYWGRKLLRPAFQSWFFSILVHLFANRYYERFGEPTPIGRAPYDDEVAIDSTTRMPGNQFLLQILQQLRSRSAVVLPADRVDLGNGRSEFEYNIEYLESQMRGADFERYLTRLDEEVSLGIFTPILLMRTADVGSYNLGVGHMQIWLWMLNALNADRAIYINKYILSRMKAFNFSEKAPAPEIVFRKLGNQNAELIRAVLTELVRGDRVKPDLLELGQMAGLSLTEVKQITADPNAPETDPRVVRQNPAADKGTGPKGAGESRRTGKSVAARVEPQVQNAFSSGKFKTGLIISMGFKRRMESALEVDGVTNPRDAVNELYARMDRWLGEIVELGNELNAEDVMRMFEKLLDSEIDRIIDGA